VSHSYDAAIRDHAFVEGDPTPRGPAAGLPRTVTTSSRARDDRCILDFHAYAYDLLATNERIMAASCDAAIKAHATASCRRSRTYLVDGVRVDRHWPARRRRARIPPPLSSYGFQKLAVEYYARAAWDQYKLPYTIVRPFNCVGVGEGRPSARRGAVRQREAGDVARRARPGAEGRQGPGPAAHPRHGDQVRALHLRRRPRRGIVDRDGARGRAQRDFNISTAQSTTVLELAEVIWRKLNGDKPFQYVSDDPYEYDVQNAVPDVTKAREVLGFEATTSLDEMLDEVIPWVSQAVREGRLSKALPVAIPGACGCRGGVSLVRNRARGAEHHRCRGRVPFWDRPISTLRSIR
jgi:hypothetical protein